MDNMAYTTIDDPSAYFQAKIYTGTGSSLALTFDGNSDLQPDLVWVKSRTNAYSNYIYDSTRGVQKRLLTDATSAESTLAQGLTAFGSDGMTFGTDAGANESSDAHVAWGWKANGGTRTTNTESGNNPGGGYQANTTGGFSIVDYTGTGAAGTMAHGLGAAPGVIIVKRRDDASSWIVYHRGNTSAPETDILELQANNATYDNSTYWNDTAPTSSVFTINTSSDGNADAATYVAYCFAEIQGYSKFGSYTGNGNADGPFIYLGFKPAWVVIKRTDSTNNWGIFDSTRDTFNQVGKQLYANGTEAEDADAAHSSGRDYLSNGFKLRETGNAINGSSATYIYMAFAEHPFVSSKGVPCTAR